MRGALSYVMGLPGQKDETRAALLITKSEIDDLPYPNYVRAYFSAFRAEGEGPNRVMGLPDQ